MGTTGENAAGRSIARLAAALVVLGSSAPAAAQQLQFPTIHFRPAVSALNFHVTDGGATLGHLSFTAGLYLHYAHSPLELVERVSGDENDIVRFRMNADLLLALGLWDRLEIGLAVPLTLAQGLENRDLLGGASRSSVDPAMGDIRLVPKLRLLTMSWFTLGVAAGLSFPTGSRDGFIGESNVTFAPKVILAMDFDRVGAAVNFGYLVREDQSFDLGRTIRGGNQREVVDDELFASVGLRVGVWREKLDLVADGFFSMATGQQDREEVPAELLGGVRIFLGSGFVANVAAGPGLTRGLGAPVFRLLAGLHYTYERKEAPPREEGDRDGDGLRDDVDKCPDDPEDKDGFQDGDGCADLDNDGDRIPDPKDVCPNDVEDPDGFKDDDGCPDPDNDGDGITDANDRCPNAPEDRDGFEDEDGCPDSDNDGDRILDAKDACPNEPETVNGVNDEDGCPDTQMTIVQGKIDVPTVYFATNKDEILAKSFPVLETLADTLKKNLWVKKVRIEGHTDDRGGVEFNLDLSKRRARSVLEFLVKQGVERDRLVSEGYGKGQPIASNKTADGRAKNRRVDFVIVDPAPKK